MPIALLHDVFPTNGGIFQFALFVASPTWAIGGVATAGLLVGRRALGRITFHAGCILLGALLGFAVFASTDRDAVPVIITMSGYVGLLTGIRLFGQDPSPAPIHGQQLCNWRMLRGRSCFHRDGLRNRLGVLLKDKAVGRDRRDYRDDHVIGVTRASRLHLKG